MNANKRCIMYQPPPHDARHSGVEYHTICGMTSPVINALRNKRARIAGEIRAAEGAIAQRREELETLDAVIRMFAPDCNPEMTPPILAGSHGLFFRYRELSRLCVDCLRKAKGPVRLDQIVDYAIAAKGWKWIAGSAGTLRTPPALRCFVWLAGAPLAESWTSRRLGGSWLGRRSGVGQSTGNRSLQLLPMT
jgi:hypothetical protein